jgi:hypothetical protein
LNLNWACRYNPTASLIQTNQEMLMARSNQGTDPVATKAASLTKALAKETGVRVEDVEKIMTRLGLESSLRYRQYVEDTSAKYKLPKAAVRLSDVSLDNIRIASGMPPI